MSSAAGRPLIVATARARRPLPVPGLPGDVVAGAEPVLADDPLIHPDVAALGEIARLAPAQVAAAPGDLEYALDHIVRR